MGHIKGLDSLEEYLEEAIRNIRHDRTIISTLLMDLMVHIKKDDQKHKEVGLIASKYVETLQRSNEQLVKISTILQKRDIRDETLSQEDKDEIFEIIKSTN